MPKVKAYGTILLKTCPDCVREYMEQGMSEVEAKELATGKIGEDFYETSPYCKRKHHKIRTLASRRKPENHKRAVAYANKWLSSHLDVRRRNTRAWRERMRAQSPMPQAEPYLQLSDVEIQRLNELKNDPDYGYRAEVLLKLGQTAKLA